MRAEIRVTYASTGGWVLGPMVTTGHRNVAIRIVQYRAAFNERRALARAAWWMADGERRLLAV